MSDNGDDHPEAIQARQDLEALSVRLFAAIEVGIDSGRAYFGDRELDPWLFPHIVRDKVLEQLTENPSGYSVHKNPMSGVEIESHGYQVRLFKKSGEDSEFLYPVGNSQGRQDFYNQAQMIIPGMEHIAQATPAQWSRPNVAYVWELQPHGFELFLVCPDGFEGIWKPGRVRWSIDIPHAAYFMAPAEAFGASNDEEDLPINLDEAADGPDDEE